MSHSLVSEHYEVLGNIVDADAPSDSDHASPAAVEAQEALREVSEHCDRAGQKLEAVQEVEVAENWFWVEKELRLAREELQKAVDALEGVFGKGEDEMEGGFYRNNSSEREKNSHGVHESSVLRSVEQVL